MKAISNFHFHNVVQMPEIMISFLQTLYLFHLKFDCNSNFGGCKSKAMCDLKSSSYCKLGGCKPKASFVSYYQIYYFNNSHCN